MKGERARYVDVFCALRIIYKITEEDDETDINLLNTPVSQLLNAGFRTCFRTPVSQLLNAGLRTCFPT